MEYLKRILKAFYLLPIILLISHRVNGDSSLDKFIRDIKSAKPAKHIGVRYQVNPKDTIWDILIRIYRIPPDRYKNYIESIKSLNPEIKDINRIYPGEVIIIPELPLKNNLILNKNISISHKRDYYIKPSKDRVFELFSKLNEDIDSGDISIPIFKNGKIKINGKTYPTIKLRNGKIIILDFDNKISSSLRKIIEKYLKGSEIVRVEGPMKNFINNILNISGYYSVRKNDKIILGEKAKIIINCDFIVEKSRNSIIGGKIYIINLAMNSSSYLPQNLIDYLESREFRVIEIKGNRYNDRRGGIYHKGVIILMNNFSPKDLVIKFLDIMGEKYERDIPIDVTRSLLDGIKFTIKGDISFKKNGKIYIITFSDVPEDISKFVERYGFKLINIKNSDKFRDIIDKVYGEIEYNYKYGSYILPKEHPVYNRIDIEIPGVYISKSNKHPFYYKGCLSFAPSKDSLIITDVKLFNPLKDIIKDEGFKIIEY